MRKPNHSNRRMVLLLAILVPFSQGCAVFMNKPDFSNRPVDVSELLVSEPTRAQRWAQNSSGTAYYLGRLVFVSAAVSAWIIAKLSDGFDSGHDIF